LFEFSTGLVALLAFVFVPGCYLLKSDRSIEGIGTAIALSIGINSFAVMIAAMNGIYTRSWFWLWILFLIPITGWLIFRPYTRLRSSPKVIQWILLPFFLCVAFKSWFLPYFTWDAIASWNRWARNFAIDPRYFENSNFFYPQLMSWGMSIPYVGSGSPALEYISHGYSFFLVLVLYAGTLRLSRAIRTDGVVSFSLLFVTYPFVSYVATGYADIGTAGFTAFALALAMESFRVDKPEYISSGLPRFDYTKVLLAGFTAGIAFLFKQSSIPVIFALCGLHLLLVCSDSLTKKFKYGAAYGFGFFIPVLPWLLSKSTTLSGPHFLYLVSGIHPDPSISGVLFSGMNLLVRQISIFDTTLGGWIFLGIAVSSVALASLRGKNERTLGLSVLICTLFWMGTASYDARALMPVMVPGAVLFSAGLEYLFRNHLLIRQFVASGIVVTSMILFLTNQFYPTLRFHGERIWDWKQGELWNRLPSISGWGSFRTLACVLLTTR